MCNIICQLEPDEGPANLHTSLRKADFLIYFTCMTTDNRTQATDHPSKVICKQLNPVPYLGGMHGISLGH